MCLCETWVLCASFSGGLPKGRKVCEDQAPQIHYSYFTRQINMDYSICNALACHTEPMNSALIIYNVACQWSINFHRHVQDSHFLSLPHITDLIPAVGKFHLAAHVPRCFARFSLNFVQGSGMGRSWRHSGQSLIRYLQVCVP